MVRQKEKGEVVIYVASLVTLGSFVSICLALLLLAVFVLVEVISKDEKCDGWYDLGTLAFLVLVVLSGIMSSVDNLTGGG